MRSLTRISLLAAIALVWVVQSAQAVNVTWNVAGGGDWDTSSTNWTGDSTVYTEGDAVTFNNAAGGVINLTANRAPASTTFSAPSGTYTLSGGNITNGPFSITSGTAGTVVLNSQIASATTVLVGSGATLRLGASERIHDGASLGSYAPSGTLDMNGFSETIGSWTGSINVINSAGLTVSGGDRNGGYMTGTGALVKTGAGNLYFQRSGGPNTYSGGTFISGLFQIYSSNDTLPTTGLVSLSPGSLLNLNLYNNAPLQTIGVLNGSGNIKTSTDNLGGTAFRVGNGGGSGSYSGVFSGNGSFTKLGNGTQILSGNNSYTGTTTISGGKLVVNGITGPSQDDYTVQANATLGGSGTINLAATKAVTVLSGGILEPGNSAGTLTINGGLNLNDGAILNMELGTGGDTIVVNGLLTGSASAGGITLNLTPINQFGTFVLLDWTGGSISGLELTDFNVVANGTLSIVGSQLLFSIPVPEPSSLLLMVGVLGCGMLRRRRNAAKDFNLAA